MEHNIFRNIMYAVLANSSDTCGQPRGRYFGIRLKLQGSLIQATVPQNVVQIGLTD